MDTLLITQLTLDHTTSLALQCDVHSEFVQTSLGPKFSSQGHFNSLQLLNVPQFLFSRLVRL